MNWKMIVTLTDGNIIEKEYLEYNDMREEFNRLKDSSYWDIVKKIEVIQLTF